MFRIGTDPPDVVEAVGLDAAARRLLDGEAHPMGTVEVLSVLAGHLALRTAVAEPELATGDTAMFEAHAAHRYACVGRQPVRGFTMVVLQPGDAGLVPPTSIAPAPPPG